MKQPNFSKLRALFWPIHGYELKKFLPMGMMMFAALFNYTIVRDIKDALVVKAAGAETISFIKFWVVLPLAVLFVMLYTKASNRLNKEQLFTYTILPFIIFFASFGFILYPARDCLLPDQITVNSLIDAAPAFRWFIMMYAKWIYVLFYAFAELWGSVVIALLFWQFANQITRVFEAKRYYAMFGLIGNFGLILSGQTLKGLTIYGESLVGSNGNPFDITLQYIMGAFTFFGLIFIYLYYWTNKNVLSDSRLYNKVDLQDIKPKKNKPKLTLAESFKMIANSKYLLLIFTLIMSYGIAINLVEVTWKKQLGKAFTSMNEYTAFMGDFSTYTGIITIVLMLVGTNIVRKFGWLTAAIITPVMLLITSSIFFGSILFTDTMVGLTSMFLTTPLLLAVFVGALQNILTKASKYSLFDSTKEMAYIPLSDDMKVKGKAAVDVIGGRFGKSGGSIIQQLLLMSIAAGVPNGQEVISPYLFGFVLIIIALWIIAICKLNKKFIIMDKKNTSSNEISAK